MDQKIGEFDVIIIGGGPGGLSAAFWCAELGLKAILLEREDEFGGQLLCIFNAITNYLCMYVTTGPKLRDLFLQRVKETHVTLRSGAGITATNLAEKTVFMTDGSQYSASSIIIATGVSRRKLSIPGEAEFEGCGILESGAASKNDVAGKRAMIVGGGDAALENALILSEVAAKIIIVHRRPEFSARNEFVTRARSHDRIEFIYDSTPTAIIGNKSVEAVIVRENMSGETSNISIDALLIRIGVEPNTALFRGQIGLDDLGYIRVDSECYAGIDGVYAVGDIASPNAPTISGAVGMGATAAKKIASSGRFR